MRSHALQKLDDIMPGRTIKLSALQRIADLCARSEDENNSDDSTDDEDRFSVHPIESHASCATTVTSMGDQTCEEDDDEIFYPNPGVYDLPSDGELHAFNDSGDETNDSDEEDDVSEDMGDEILTAPSGISWRRTPLPARRLQRNIISFNEGPTIKPLTPLESFFLFFTEFILRSIMRLTNRRMRVKKEKLFSYAEMKAAIAVIIRAGADKDNLSDLNDLFHPSDSRPFYRCAISKNRIRKFMQNVTLDEKQTRKDRQKTDKLAAVREIWDLFTLGLRKYYVPSPSLTIDEQLYGFRGYAPGRCYMPSKPAKYGIKIFWLCDAKNGFALESYLYSGKDEGRTLGLAEHIVMKLISFYSFTWRNIYMDRFFTNHSLCKTLLNNGLTMTGTIVSGRRDVPHKLRNVRDRIVLSSLGVYDHENRIMMISYVPKRNKNVLLMTSMHQTLNVNSERADCKPDIILDYNSWKGGVDLMDSRIGDFTCKRMTRRYPLIFLFNMLDISLLNSFLIMEINGYKESRKQFIKTVSQLLAMDNIKERCNNSKVYAKSKDAFMRFGIKPDATAAPPSGTQSTGPRKCQIDKCKISTRNRCTKCIRPMCTEHRVSTCTDCYL